MKVVCFSRITSIEPNLYK